MILTYLDGYQKVLGQWFENTPLGNATVHRLEPDYQWGLRFFLSNPQGNPYLERVELRTYECRMPPAHIPNQIIVDADRAVSTLYQLSCAASD